MLMGLGDFVFGLDTLAYNELQRQTQWKHRASPRVGARDSRQYTGPGDDTITLSGTLAPALMGDPESIGKLRKMADAGKGYAMVDGAGVVYGVFVIESLSESQMQHYEDGTPRLTDFTIGLARTDEDNLDLSDGWLGDINDDDNYTDYTAYA